MKNKFLLTVTLVALTINGFSQNTKPILELVSKGSNLPVDIYRIVGLEENGTYTTFFQVFSCVSTNFEKIVISEEKSKIFLESYAAYDWLIANNKTEWFAPIIFLDKKDGEYVVRQFRAGNKELTGFARFVSPIKASQTYNPFCRPLVIIPKTKK